MQRIKTLFQSPQPVGPAHSLQMFTPEEGTITKDVVRPEGEGWSIEVGESRTIQLFKIDTPKVDNCMLTYRADLKSEALSERAYLEMWCRIPRRGEFFSKGFHNALKGTNNWSTCEVPFYLKRGQQPDLIKLNLTVEGQGKVWLKNIELLYTPLK